MWCEGKGGARWRQGAWDLLGDVRPGAMMGGRHAMSHAQHMLGSCSCSKRRRPGLAGRPGRRSLPSQDLTRHEDEDVPWWVPQVDGDGLLHCSLHIVLLQGGGGGG